MSDVDNAISCFKKAIEVIPLVPGSAESGPDLHTVLENLGNSFSSRFACTKNRDDIDSAISAFHQAASCDIEPSSSTSLEQLCGRDANLPYCLTYLALAFLDRFELMEDPMDITNAISVLQRAVNLISNTPEDRVFFLTNLASALWGRFNHSKDVTDLHDAISHQRSAVDLTPPGHVQMPELLNNLGLYLYWCFQETKIISDVDNAISCFEKAIEVIPLVLWLGREWGGPTYRFREPWEFIFFPFRMHQEQRGYRLSNIGISPGFLL